MITFAPCFAASADSEPFSPGFQCCAIVPGSSFARAISSQPTMCLPCDSTIACTRWMNFT